MSPIMEAFYLSTGIDPVFIIAAVLLLTIISFILAIISLVKIKRLRRKYNVFMKGKDAESLEDIIMAEIEQAERIISENKEIKQEINLLQENQKITFQKMGMVKYNAFREMTGDLSYALALLDKENNGFIINSVYTKEGGYSYIKRISDGKSEIELSEDEREALDKAVSC